MRKIKRYKLTHNIYKAKDTDRIKAIRTILKMHLWKKFKEAPHILELAKALEKEGK